MKKVEAEVGQIRSDLEDERKKLAAEIASRVLGREVKGS
jgi:flagellar biosynthesis/type III secretory pathway protein FliH